MRRGIFLALLSIVLVLQSFSESFADVLSVGDIQRIVATTSARSLLDWKVGDSQTLKVKLSIGMEGVMEKKVIREEPAGFWLEQKMVLPIITDVSEILVDRNTGKPLKIIRNGKEEQIPEDEGLEIVQTKPATIEVPAGKFKVMHVLAKTKAAPQVEIWVNPQEIALDGTAKLYVQSQVTFEMELEKFTKQ